MNNKIKTVMNWSSGKDAALAFHYLLQSKEYEVTQLLTTLSSEHKRVFMHGIHEELLELQAQRVGLPLTKIHLPASPDDGLYSNAMHETMLQLQSQGVTAAAFGDIFLEDLRAYREQQLEQAGMQAVFPLWGRSTIDLIDRVEQAGIEAVIVCVNAKCLGREVLGKKITKELINSFPPGVDPCGENGEYHSFVYNAPFFSASIPIDFGETVHKTYQSPQGDAAYDTSFYFLDVLPAC